MSSFKGSTTYAVDDKGRINIPAKFRKDLSAKARNTFVAIRGFEKCLRLYPLDEWNRIEPEIRKLSSNDAQNRFYKRMMLDVAAEAKLDAQSRFMIPKELLEYTGIESDVLIIGQIEYIEVWNPQIYRDYIKAQHTSFEAVAQNILPK
jgi:MraZ protein